MRNNIKALYLAFIIAALSITAYNNKSLADDEATAAATTAENPQLEIIKESREKKPVMQTRKWNTPDYGNKDKEAEEHKEVTSTDKKEENSDEGELTTEQKIWNRYRKIAEGEDNNRRNESSSEEGHNKDQEEVAANEKDTTGQNADEGNPDAQEDPEKQETGLAAILQRYKKSQQSKRNMQTRSLGSID